MGARRVHEAPLAERLDPLVLQERQGKRIRGPFSPLTRWKISGASTTTSAWQATCLQAPTTAFSRRAYSPIGRTRRMVQEEDGSSILTDSSGETFWTLTGLRSSYS